jgi:3-oxoacyl-[acyl-carrier protein] reductase
MDLGISNRKAIVCAASEGLGRACSLALAREGVDLVMNARRPKVLAAAAEEIRRATGAAVITVAADISTERLDGFPARPTGEHHVSQLTR